MRASGMTVLPHYVIYGAKFAISEGRLEPHIKGWVTLLEKLRDGKIYIE